jgi:hypothetical protein
MNKDQPWITLEEAVGGVGNSTMPSFGDIPLDHFSSTCYYFGEALVEGLGGVDTPIGLIHTAWGGSMIEQWLTNDVIAECKGAAVSKSNGLLYDNAVKPYLGMTVKGWVFYQGENNAGGLHGNSGTASQPASGCVTTSRLPATWFGARGWWTGCTSGNDRRPAHVHCNTPTCTPVPSRLQVQRLGPPKC